MCKVYLIFNGNEIIDAGFDEKEMIHTYEWLVKNNDSDYKAYELLEFEVSEPSKDKVSALCIYKLNGKPYTAIINNEEFLIRCPEDDGEYRKYSYEIMYVQVIDEKFIVRR